MVCIRTGPLVNLVWSITAVALFAGYSTSVIYIFSIWGNNFLLGEKILQISRITKRWDPSSSGYRIPRTSVLCYKVSVMYT